MSLFFFHGLESGPHGSKFQMISSEFPELVSPDFQNMDLNQRLLVAEEQTRGMSGMTIVGSSFGGLVAARLYSHYPERIENLVLLAPALHTEDANLIARMPSPNNCKVIHGTQDSVVPFEASERFCQKFDLPLVAVADEHRLAAPYSKEAIMAAVHELYTP
ncbi:MULTISPECIES: alpha/beta fold hydrolase [Gammaproteobacteria]|uniref:alpha/beta fold hydrolase n=1 Tax=Gammaproteobacteria TaxID=1236 RepID=UPI000DD00860|nr:MULTISPECIES: alpha/beta fold hydrolase [Gammaproteobacteria]RTE86267.1 alpha/beta fold hydrolase [Aliidiomarina sp. B3213]TCZ91618.1 alpha/beta fold hydrolase [Lysobacter sp. N42]